MAVADNSVLRVVVSLLLPESVIAQNIYYVFFDGNGASDDEDDVLSDVVDWVEAIYTEFDDHIDASVALTGLKLYIYDSVDDDWDAVGDALLADTFAGVGDITAHGVALLMHAKTTNPDVQAGKFFGGLVKQSMLDGVWQAGSLAAAVLAAVEWSTAFVGAATGSDFGPGVWSTAKNSFFHFSGVEVINAYPGYQRRRKPGVGI